MQSKARESIFNNAKPAQPVKYALLYGTICIYYLIWQQIIAVGVDIDAHNVGYKFDIYVYDWCIWFSLSKGSIKDEIA